MAKHRLKDIVVEEVSLVDRAANRRRYLLIKRELMDPTTTPNPTDGDGDNASAHPFQPALDALTALTESVEQLTDAPQEESDQRLGNIANQLREMAERIRPAQPSSDQSSGATQALLQAVGELREALMQTRKAEDEDGTPKVPQKKPASLRDQLMAIAQSLRALAAGMGQQERRLKTLEKNVGLPNSQSEPAPKKPDAESWPLDLNQPFDRDSVNKALSFYDL